MADDNKFTLAVVKVDDNVDGVMDQVRDKVRLALSLMGEVVEGYAKEDCPVDTGLLRNSITHVTAGDTISKTYHASYGENRNKKGQRYGAGSKNAGSVRMGRINAQVGSDKDPEEYVGSNVEYAPYVEFGDRYHHDVGKAHFLRDAGQDHIDELRDVAQKTLNTL